MVKVILEGENKIINIKAKTVREVLEKLNLKASEVVVYKGDEVLLEDDYLEDNDEIRIVPVASGG